MFEKHLIQKGKIEMPGRGIPKKGKFDSMGRNYKPPAKDGEKKGGGVDKAMTAGSSPATGSNLMHMVADGTQPSSTQKSKDVDKGFMTHIGKKPTGSSINETEALRRKTQRPAMRAANKVKMKTSPEGLRNLHKAMKPVMEGLKKLCKSFETIA